MGPRRYAVLAVLSGTLVLNGWVAAELAGLGPHEIDTDGVRIALDTPRAATTAGERFDGVSVQEIINARQMVRDIYMDEKVEQYILDIVFATRNPSEFGLDSLKPLISYGSSPRGSINLALAAKAIPCAVFDVGRRWRIRGVQTAMG